MNPFADRAIEEAVKTIPNTIKETASRPLGIFALMIIYLRVLGFAFFRRANQYVQLAIFLSLFAGVTAFAFSIRNTRPVVHLFSWTGSVSMALMLGRKCT